MISLDFLTWLFNLLIIKGARFPCSIQASLEFRRQGGIGHESRASAAHREKTFSHDFCTGFQRQPRPSLPSWLLLGQAMPGIFRTGEILFRSSPIKIWERA
jgi:hypothetical protein